MVYARVYYRVPNMKQIHNVGGINCGVRKKQDMALDISHYRYNTSFSGRQG
jgi:hypothetical protein